MWHLRSICLAIAASVLLGASAKAQDIMPLAYPDETLSQLKKTQTPVVALAVEKISANWTFIANSFTKVGGPTEDFQRGMEHNKLLLRTAATEPNDQYSAILLSYVEEDLAIKANYISEVAAVTAAAYSEVAVDVRTVKNGQEINGYFVGFSPKYLAGSDPMYRFNSPTSPSSGKLPPGRYEMTAILNGQIVQRQEVSIGILGQQGQPITCSVP